MTTSSSQSQAVSGLAASIRSSVESETFDLAGQSPASIERVITDAFGTPFSSLRDMIRITLITGAGKLERQKYDENAGKTCTRTLKNLGFVEDQGASAILECAGCYKLQHDTGKNLKTVVVFPRITVHNNDEDHNDHDQGDHHDTTLAAPHDGMPGLSLVQSFLPEGSPEPRMIGLILTTSDMPTFERMMSSKCPSWSQKKACGSVIDHILTLLNQCDQKLLSGTQQLTEDEQALYDSVSVTNLEKKSTKIKELMQQHIHDERITVLERKQLLEQVKERIETLTREIAKIAQEQQSGNRRNANVNKRVEALTAQQSKAHERQKKLQDIVPQSTPHALKNEAAIQKLRKELEPLMDIEKRAKGGRLLTLKESQMVARKEDILLEIAQLETSSRGWFETDDAFQTRVKASQSDWEATRKQTKKKTSASPKPIGSTSNAATSSSKWTTNNFAATHHKKPVVQKPSAKSKVSDGSMFQAMMMDSDSD